MFDAVTSNTENRDWLQLGTPKETPVEIAAAEDPLLPDWMRRTDGTFPRTIADIIDAVGRHRGLTRSMIRSDRRDQQITHARHEISYWASRLSTLSLPSIGRQMGGRDHTTVLHGIKRHAERSGLPFIDTKLRMIARDQRAKELAAHERRIAGERRAALAAEARLRRMEMELNRKKAIEERERSFSFERVVSCKADGETWCRDHGLDPDSVRVGRLLDTVEARHRMFAYLRANKGYSARTIAAAFGRGADAVRRILREAGLTSGLRNRGEA
jgi:hypothetical protein